MAVQITSEDLARVRIPAELNRELDQFYSALKARTLEAAVRRAACRATTDDNAIVQKDDMAECAREVLTNSLSDIAMTFSSFDCHHVRIAS